MSSTDKQKKNINKNAYRKIEETADTVWSRNGLFDLKPKSSKDAWSIMMPPPNVTGNLHIGHALNMTLQDVLTRFWRMKGRDAYWQPGTDHAGIATQMVVERKIMKEKKLTKNNLGREKFIEEVWNWKNESGDEILKQLKRLGASANWKNERFTLDQGLSESVTKVFVKLFNDGIIYRDKRLVNWDIKLETAISDLEVVQKEVTGNYWYFKYFLEDNSNFIVVATTRPETMLGDTGIAVHPNDSRYSNFIGKNVILPIVERKIPIVADHYADPKKGTGAVKITPAHDFNDFEVGKRNNLNVINILNPDGTLNNNVPENYKGLDRFEARKKILKTLDQDNYLVKIEETVHFVPYGDRSDTIVEPYLTDQWFLNAKKLSHGAIAAVENKETIFIPKNWENTFFEWMRNIEPWCISRQLWWGHRIPAWYSDEGKIFVAENEKEAKKIAKNFYKKDIQLRRDSDVLDTWFSSGLWPFSTLGWPENTDLLKRYYPGSTLITGFDIIFFWVARMMMFGIYFMKKSPFKEIYVHALVRDSKGQKMSKSKGNVVDPIILMDKYSTAALRFTLVALSTYGQDLKLSENRIIGYRNFITKISNASKFLIINECAIDKNFKLNLKFPVNNWIYFHLLNTSKNVSNNLKVYRFNDAASELYHFVWHKFCDWYLEIIKPILVDKDNDFYDETKALSALVFKEILSILHPIIPFHTEYLYTKIHKFGDCLALDKWPSDDNIKKYDSENNKIEWVLNFITEVRSIRNILNIPNKLLINIQYKKIDDKKELFISNYIKYFKNLSNIENFQKVSNIKKHTAQIVVGEEIFYIPLQGLIDIDKETQRLKKELEKINHDIEKINQKLKNKGFLKNAPEDIIIEQNARIKILENTKNRILLAVKRLIKL